MHDTFIIDSVGLEAENLDVSGPATIVNGHEVSGKRFKIVFSKTIWYDMLRFVNEEISEAYADENLPASYKDYDENVKGETK